MHEVALLKPDIQIRSLADLDLFRLRQKGIKAVLIDLDNTISPWRQNRITREARDFFRRAAAEGIRVILFTNAKEPRARKAAAAAGLEVFPAAKKTFSRLLCPDQGTAWIEAGPDSDHWGSDFHRYLRR